LIGSLLATGAFAAQLVVDKDKRLYEPAAKPAT
jgi:hypothetical protein